MECKLFTFDGGTIRASFVNYSGEVPKFVALETAGIKSVIQVFERAYSADGNSVFKEVGIQWVVANKEELEILREEIKMLRHKLCETEEALARERKGFG